MISVIATVYDRDRFILDALDSLKNQTISSRSFEVIVVTNIRLNIPNHYPFELKILDSDKKSLAEKIYQGLHIAKGSIVSFIEDDDLFEESKLEIVNQAMSDSQAIYFHNAHTKFKSIYKSNNNGLLNHHKKILGHKSLFNTCKSFEYNNVIRLLSLGCDFNLSSISVRKDSIMSNIDIIRSASKYVDTTVFLSSIIQNGSIVCTKIPLTRLRLHSSNSSGVQRSNKERSVYENEIVKFRDLCNELGVDTFISSIISNWILLDELLKSGYISRLSAIKSMVALIKASNRTIVRKDVLAKTILAISGPRILHRALRIFHE